MNACGSYLIGDYPVILEWTPVIFGSLTEGILELLDGYLEAFQVEIVARQLGAHLEPKACGALESFKKEDPTSRSCH